MNTCVPLELVNRITLKYPACWEQVEEFRAGKRTGELQWDDHCYIPIAGGIAIVSNGGVLSKIESTHMQDATIIAASAPWRLYKQIFCFDADMEALLYAQAEDLVIPIEILNNLPYQSLYIETKLFDDIDGFFVHFESDVNDGRLELRFLIVSNDLNIFPIAIHLKSGNTIKDGVGKMIQEATRVAKQMGDVMVYKVKKNVHEEQERLYHITSKLMQLVLYICAENKEVGEDERQSKITKIPKSREFIKDKYREIKKWNCGVETGNIIRGIYKKSNYVHYQISESPGFGSPKRPHARRAHWHHYWIGAKKDGERKLELKWIAPTFVHGGDIEDNSIIKVNRVKNEKGKD